jgi:hypothetical protein
MEPWDLLRLTTMVLNLPELSRLTGLGYPSFGLLMTFELVSGSLAITCGFFCCLSADWSDVELSLGCYSVF